MEGLEERGKGQGARGAGEGKGGTASEGELIGEGKCVCSGESEEDKSICGEECACRHPLHLKGCLFAF